jgi:hypothetical protein
VSLHKEGGRSAEERSACSGLLLLLQLLMSIMLIPSMVTGPWGPMPRLPSAVWRWVGRQYGRGGTSTARPWWRYRSQRGSPYSSSSGR